MIINFIYFFYNFANFQWLKIIVLHKYFYFVT